MPKKSKNKKYYRGKPFINAEKITPEDNIFYKWSESEKIWAEVDYSPPYSYNQFEQAFWHLFTLNCYHVTMSFDVNMVILLDWGISYHLEQKS